jgi:hypothetical protein
MTYKERVASRKVKVKGQPGRGLPGPRPRHVCDETCEHFRTSLEKELSAKVAAVLKAVPAGMRATMEGVPWVDVRIVCSGAQSISALYCCMKPNHPGRCYSSNKNVEFTPDPPEYS